MTEQPWYIKLQEPLWRAMDGIVLNKKRSRREVQLYFDMLDRLCQLKTLEMLEWFRSQQQVVDDVPDQAENCDDER